MKSTKRSKRKPYEGRPALLNPPREYKPDDLLIESETAAFLRLKPHTLRVWRGTHRQPLLKFIRMGNHPRAPIRYRFSDLQAFVEASRSSTSA